METDKDEVDHPLSPQISSHSNNDQNNMTEQIEAEKSPIKSFMEAGHRMRLFRADGDSWLDMGTGTCVLLLLKGQTDDSEPWPDRLILQFHDESNPETIFCESILSVDPLSVSRQQGRWIPTLPSLIVETVIIWKSEEGADLAVSLETVQGCEQLWEILSGFYQGSLDFAGQLEEIQMDQRDLSLQSDKQQQIQQLRQKEELQMQSLRLPETVTFDNLAEIEGTLQVAIRHMTGKRNISAQVLDLGLIPQLLDLFRIAEDLQNIPILHQLYYIMRGIVLLNTPTVLSELFEDHHIMQVVGIFECTFDEYIIFDDSRRRSTIK